jgi:hypothetical protein
VAVHAAALLLAGFLLGYAVRSYREDGDCPSERTGRSRPGFDALHRAGAKCLPSPANLNDGDGAYDLLEPLRCFLRCLRRKIAGQQPTQSRMSDLGFE